MDRTTVSTRRRSALLLAAAACLVASATACDGSSSAAPPSAPPSPSTSAPAGLLDIRDPWVKAADRGMTAAFGTLVNDGDADVTISAAATEVSAMELHEMTMKDGKIVMQPKQGGILVKAHSAAVLQPGGDHLMLMDLKQPVRAGDELAFTLTFTDGRTQTFTAVAKPFTGAQESYSPGHGDAPSPGTSATAGTSASPQA
ncbi:copper chaperone PCu(A)C [Micromonospora costi]|uniref:copper chaperone PCu(A)C n=1 Tax=Micromonospora costi TaxID=1530042 RepID=UPI0033C3F7F9